MIPPLQPDGTLHPGIHRATLAEVIAAFSARNEQRRILSESLAPVVHALWRLDAHLDIFVDGSYVTSKPEPNDIDLLIITPLYNEVSIQAHLDHVCPVEAVSMSVYVEPQLPTSILDFFTTTRRGTAKGILQLDRS